MTWQLRRASVDDLDDIMTIERETFPDDAWSEQAMRSELTSGHTYYLVATEAGDTTLAGYGGLSAPRGSGQGDIQTLAVAASARRRGLGRLLLLSLLGEARQRGADEVFLEVRADNPAAQALYESVGFERISVRRRYYRGGIDAVIMRLQVPEARTTTAGEGSA